MFVLCSNYVFILYHAGRSPAGRNGPPSRLAFPPSRSRGAAPSGVLVPATWQRSADGGRCDATASSAISVADVVALAREPRAEPLSATGAARAAARGCDGAAPAGHAPR